MAQESMPQNVDPDEIARFNRLAENWWNPEGEFKPLHDLNPARLGYIKTFCELKGSKVLDVGCGAGLLSEAMAEVGAEVTGIDLAEEALAAARTHAETSGVKLEYHACDAETYAADHSAAFDLVTCLEMLEHVPDSRSVINACAEAVRPGGKVVFSTINRTVKAFALGIVAAEYVLGLLAKGTHEYRKLIRPSELVRWGRGAGLELEDLQGVQYRPHSGEARIGGDVAINYIACFAKT